MSDPVQTARMPEPSSKETKARWEQSALVYRMVTGKWTEDARAYQHKFFGKTARQFLPDPVTSRNPLMTFNRQKSVIYDEAPVVNIADESDAGEIGIDADEPPETEAPDLDSIITESLWPLRQECLLLTLAANECAMRADWDAKTGKVRYRVIPAHRLEAWASPEDPTNPYKVRELRPRHLDGESVWTWETWDVGPKGDKAEFKIEKVDEKGRLIDVTQQVMGKEYEGPYPYTDKDGAVMPYVLYHSRVTNRLFSPWLNSELVNGTLVVATCWTWWLGGLRDGSYPQRVIFNGKVKTTATASQEGYTGVEYVEMSPLTLLQISGDNASIGQYQASMDPQSVGQAIEAFEVGLATHADLSPGDMTQTGNSGMSGYAISISREGLRKAQVRLIPSQRMGDRLLLATAARISNIYGGTAHSTEPTDYLISYADIPKSLEETNADLARYEKLAALDLMDPVDAMLDQNPSWTRAQAVAKILDVMKTKALLAKVKRQFAAETGQPTPPTTPPPGEDRDADDEDQAERSDDSGPTEGSSDEGGQPVRSDRSPERAESGDDSGGGD